MKPVRRIAATVLARSLALGLWQGGGRRDLGDLSLRFFSKLFQSPEAREVFGVEEEEVRAVFGELSENTFL